MKNGKNTKENINENKINNNMKTLTTILLLTLALSSCKDDPIEQAPPAPDCNCDKYVEVNTFNISGTIVSYWTTINECTGIQKSGDWNENDMTQQPVLGECK